MLNHNYIDYPQSFNVRGNLTQTLRWLNPAGGGNSLPTCGQSTSSNALSTTSAYDDTGQLQSVTDPKGNSTGYSYQDPDSANAYVKQITYPSTNGVSHIEKFTYASDGKLTESRDQNDQPTTYLHDDPFRRLTKITDPAPEGGETKFDYSEASSPFSLTTTTKFDNSKYLSSTVVFDGMGRVFQNCNASGAVVEKHYDGFGRVREVSNPFFGPCGVIGGSQWTTTSYDAIGRITTIPCVRPNGTRNTICP